MQLRPHQTEALQSMADNDLGQVIVPTGGGKTMCMIHDVIREITDRDYEQTIVVVAPRILLAEQLCSEFLEMMHEFFLMSQSISVSSLPTDARIGNFGYRHVMIFFCLWLI